MAYPIWFSGFAQLDLRPHEAVWMKDGRLAMLAVTKQEKSSVAVNKDKLAEGVAQGVVLVCCRVLPMQIEWWMMPGEIQNNGEDMGDYWFVHDNGRKVPPAQPGQVSARAPREVSEAAVLGRLMVEDNHKLSTIKKKFPGHPWLLINVDTGEVRKGA